MAQPLLIALNGIPTSGKSEVQRILNQDFGIVSVDDGLVGRRACADLFDIPLDDLSSQEGKLKRTEIQGVSWENRKVVGEYLAALEEIFGGMTVPNWAIRQALARWDRTPPAARGLGYSFGSVRRSQGQAYREAGGFVIEIIRPGVAPTGNVWDQYEQSFVTHRIMNDGTLSELRDKVVEAVEQILVEHVAAPGENSGRAA